jgi:methylmalonyl-CoA mutase C-terminal domain/subunit
MTLIPKIVAELRTRGLDEVLVFAGGIIPADDIATLEAEGVAAVFTPGSPLTAITDWLERALDSREGESAK